ncbi:hypothetical protein GLOTRDRAFT_111092 [Gloeophyllum trabeum ATCC 11539]|uniref:RRM domain-containing protein n=1 Tax=Gloeophyllum trabeum (strain ATCC 11539 / FP-39264 / Madison 617) TaxID=670483 RepID=S7Q6G3_GLOTA|nr:uncharacterized protein GLOTRDRAFT_111092 [Gloeophyllum trabeum ATCC 11539]EPQ55003.1 hypothetical protein GLOTRDRAFT_111092 [Gloeophyllum trabeum ATCC 11539]
MDKSLDEMIKTQKKTRSKAKPARRRSSGVKQQLIGKGAPAAAASPSTKAARKAAAAVAPAATTPQPADKIIVSNLPLDVTEAQIKDLFQTTVGPLRAVQLNYDASGRSKGVATVHFQRKGDGTKAFQQYNNRLIDGKRPMKVEIVISTPVAQPSLAARVAPAPVAAAVAPKTAKKVKKPAKKGRKKAEPRPAKTAADLDAEMEDYTASNAPAAA